MRHQLRVILVAVVCLVAGHLLWETRVGRGVIIVVDVLGVAALVVNWLRRRARSPESGPGEDARR